MHRASHGTGTLAQYSSARPTSRKWRWITIVTIRCSVQPTTHGIQGAYPADPAAARQRRLPRVLSALGLGSDYAGSIRVPAHFSGVVGLKPSWGSIPGIGHLFGPFDPFTPAPLPVVSMATIGPMARYVDDLTLAYNVLRGSDPHSPYTVPTNEARPQTVDVKKMRCALFTDGGGVPVSSEIAT